MNSNFILKILCSLPAILIASYFTRLLGICLIILRHFVYRHKNYSRLSLDIIAIGFILLVPKVFYEISKFLKFNNSIPYLNEIITSNIYVNLIEYSKFLLCLGIILLIISSIVNRLFSKALQCIRTYIHAEQKINAEISKQNDMEIKLKQERAKNTHVVFCPYCGADNMLTEKVGNCKYCRRQIEYKE